MRICLPRSSSMMLHQLTFFLSLALRTTLTFSTVPRPRGKSSLSVCLISRRLRLSKTCFGNASRPVSCPLHGTLESVRHPFHRPATLWGGSPSRDAPCERRPRLATQRVTATLLHDLQISSRRTRGGLALRWPSSHSPRVHYIPLDQGSSAGRTPEKLDRLASIALPLPAPDPHYEPHPVERETGRAFISRDPRASLHAKRGRPGAPRKLQ